jgi:Creatinine amidohydrolase
VFQDAGIGWRREIQRQLQADINSNSKQGAIRMSKGYFLEQLTWPKAKEAFKKTSFVVFPLGSNEQHGPALPTGTDWMVAKEMARRLGERANVIVTPTLPIGFPRHALSQSGDVDPYADRDLSGLAQIRYYPHPLCGWTWW